MKTSLVIFATLLAACDLSSSYVQRTRVTAGGGEYTLFASDPQRVPASIAQALMAISSDCGGTYEVMGLELLPTGPKYTFGYLDTSLQLALWGSFHNGIAYECRPPQSTALNQQLQQIAASAPPPPPPAPPKPACLVTNECPPGRVCGLSQAECDSY
ncbi:MAG TPA: hypothetical protein VH083_08510 [Myxococcales bacterium]|jgi:hypothetical protein|nr:hypothetical protein [Myxococcales bacterium]